MRLNNIPLRIKTAQNIFYKGYILKIGNDIDNNNVAILKNDKIVMEVDTEQEAKDWIDDKETVGIRRFISYKKIATPAGDWDNLSTDVQEQNWNILFNGIKNPKIYNFAQDIMQDSINPKFSDSLIEGLNYVDEAGLSDKKLNYIFAYIKNRITTDQRGDFAQSIKSVTDLLAKASEDILPDTEQDFIDLTVGSGNVRNIKLVCDKCGHRWDDDTLIDIMLYCMEFCDNDYKNHNLTDVLTMKYLYNAPDANIQNYLDAKQQEPLKSLKASPGKQAIRKWFAEGKDLNNEYFQFVLHNCDKFKPKSNPRGIIELLDDSVSDTEKQSIMNAITTTAARRAKNRIIARLEGRIIR